jgi:CBS domain containing-hemolysin-like protein
MESQTWELVVRIAALILSLIGGVGVVPVISWLKDSLNLDGRWAQVLTAGVATLVATLTLVVQGQIAPESVTLESASQLLLAVLIASQAEYRRIKDAAAS